MSEYITPCATIPLAEADKLFFSEESAKRQAQAKALCAQCKLTAECLERGMAALEFGIFGGLTAKERQAL